MEDEKTRSKKDYDLLKSIGICTVCRKRKALDGKSYCPECLEAKILYNDKYFKRPEVKEREQKRMQKRYIEHKENGICLSCNKKASYGFFCYEHYIYRKRASKKLAEKRRLQRAEAKERIKNGEVVEGRAGEA